MSMIEIAAVATITILAVISPGADFAMVTRNSLIYGRRAGLLTSIGIATGVQLHVLYTMLGVAILIKSSPEAFWAIKLAGAGYLVYIGYQTFVSRIDPDRVTTSSSTLNAFIALRTGFFTNALNPKTMLFIVSVYTQVVRPDTPLSVQIAYGLFISIAHWLWFSVVSLFFSEERLRQRMLRHQVLLNGSIGVILAAIGIWLAIEPVATK